MNFLIYLSLSKIHTIMFNSSLGFTREHMIKFLVRQTTFLHSNFEGITIISIRDLYISPPSYQKLSTSKIIEEHAVMQRRTSHLILLIYLNSILYQELHYSHISIVRTSQMQQSNIGSIRVNILKRWTERGLP